MATKARNAGETAEPAEETAEGPLLDTMGVAVKKMVAKGKERGYVTYDELNAALPADEASSEQIEDTMSMLSEMGINLVESEETEEAAAAEKAPAEGEEPAADAEPSAAGNVDEEDLGRTDDPVRMYLREMGSVELLSREGEIAIAKRIEAGREMMIGGICESPMTIRALLEWHDALVDSKMLLRDIIDLDATYSPKVDFTQAPAEGAEAAEPEAEEPEEEPAEPRPEGGDDADADSEENNISLAAMEEELRPKVIATLEAIDGTYKRMRRVQQQRLTYLQKGQKVPPPTEKRYDKLKHEMVELMEGVHLNNARIEQLVHHMNDLNRRLMTMEGRLLRLAESCRIKRQDFLELLSRARARSHLDRADGGARRQVVEGFRSQTRTRGEGDPPGDRRNLRRGRPAGGRIPPHRFHGAEGRARRQPRQEGHDRGQPAPRDLDRQEVHQPRPAIPRPDPGRQYRPDEGGG